MVNGIYSAWMLRRRPRDWLANRGLSAADDSDLRVVWVRGEMGFISELNAAWLVVVVTRSFVLVECPAPFQIRRKRVVVRDGSMLLVNGYVTVPNGTFKIHTRPPERLLDALAALGWPVQSAGS